jgi:hypothetical protein
MSSIVGRRTGKKKAGRHLCKHEFNNRYAT